MDNPVEIILEIFHTSAKKLKIKKQTTDLIPIIGYTENGEFVTNTVYQDFVQTACKDLNNQIPVN